MLTFPIRLFLPVALVLLLSACGNSPQQPSDTVDDRTAESPYLGEDDDDTTTDSAASDTEPTRDETAVADADINPDTEPSDSGLGEAPDDTDPVTTGGLPQSTAVDIGSIAGDWAADPADCGAENGATITISATRFESQARACAIDDLIDAGDGALTATLACSAGAGDAEPELVKLTPQGDQLQLAFVGSDEPDQTLERCP